MYNYKKFIIKSEVKIPLTAFIVNLFTPDLVLTFTTTFRSDGLGTLSTSITLFDRRVSGDDKLLLVDLLSDSNALSSSLKKN